MTLLTIAEVLAGELLVSLGGLVDRTTAKGEDVVMWQQLLPQLNLAEAETDGARPLAVIA